MDTAAAIDFLKAKVALIFAHSWTKKKAEAYEKERLQFLKESTAHMVGHPVVIQLATELKAHFVDQLVLELADKKHSLENQNWIPEAASRQSETDWENKLGELESTPPKMAQLFALDNLLEAAIKRQVPADCRFTLTAFLTENYGIKRLNSRSIKSATPKALTDDWVALLPRADPPPLAHIERTPEQLALMPPVMKDQKVWTITATTIGELAQLYADHSGHEVRLEKALLGRPNQYVGRQINGKAELADMLSQHLSINEIELMHRLGGIIELKDNWAKEAERRKKSEPQPITEEFFHRARDALSLEQFWTAVDAAKSDHREPNKFAKSLRQVTKTWTVDEVLGFNIRLEEALAQAYTWEIWGVAYLINGGCSDDGFLYFRLWLIAQGPDVFNATLLDPSHAADFASSSQNNEFEDFRFIAADIYGRHARKPLPIFSDFIAAPQMPSGQKWEETDLEKQFPSVFEKFG